MARIAYVNGRYVIHSEARVAIEDRGYQFSDGVYEVIWVREERIVDLDLHLARLDRSLGALYIAWPMSRAAFVMIIGEVRRRNRLRKGFLYIQVSRGVAPRNHVFPDAVKVSLVITANWVRRGNERILSNGAEVISIPDIRWKRCDIKTISLLPNVLGRQRAREANCYESWQVNERGFITEGTACNAWIVTSDNEIVTHPADHAILSGITRKVVIDLARREGMTIVERPFTLVEAKAAKEAFLTSTTSFVVPVVRIDEAQVGNGRPGPLTLRLLERYLTHMAGEDGTQ